MGRRPRGPTLIFIAPGYEAEASDARPAAGAARGRLLDAVRRPDANKAVSHSAPASGSPVQGANRTDHTWTAGDSGPFPTRNGSYVLNSPISIPALPLAIGPLRQDPALHGYRFGSEPAGDPHVVRTLAEVALDLGQGGRRTATGSASTTPDDPPSNRK